MCLKSPLYTYNFKKLHHLFECVRKMPFDKKKQKSGWAKFESDAKNEATQRELCLKSSLPKDSRRKVSMKRFQYKKYTTTKWVYLGVVEISISSADKKTVFLFFVLFSFFFVYVLFFWFWCFLSLVQVKKQTSLSVSCHFQNVATLTELTLTFHL